MSCTAQTCSEMNVADYSAVKARELPLKTKKAHSLSALPAGSATQTTKNV